MAKTALLFWTLLMFKQMSLYFTYGYLHKIKIKGYYYGRTQKTYK